MQVSLDVGRLGATADQRLDLGFRNCPCGLHYRQRWPRPLSLESTCNVPEFSELSALPEDRLEANRTIQQNSQRQSIKRSNLGSSQHLHLRHG